MKVKLSIALFFGMLSIANAQSGFAACMGLAGNTPGAFSSSLTLIAISAAIVIALIALAYMLGEGSHDEKLSVWSKDESANLVISLILASVVIGAFLLSCNVAWEYFGERSPYQISYNYLDGLSNRAGLATIGRLTRESLDDQIKATAFIYTNIPYYGGMGRAYHANVRARSAQKELVMDIMMPAIVSLKLQKIVLESIESFGLLLLALAIFLRVLPFTRDIGNFLVAIAFSLYVIFPFTYAINALTEQASPNMGIPPSGSFDFALDRNPACEATGNCTLLVAGSLFPQAILFPNISIVIMAACTAAIWKFLRGFAA